MKTIPDGTAPAGACGAERSLSRDGSQSPSVDGRRCRMLVQSAMPKEQQTERVGMRFTPSEVAMLEALSEATGLTMSNVVRQAVRREYAERFGSAAPKSKPKPKPQK